MTFQTLHAEQTGTGSPVALLHGLFGRGRNLAGVARALAASHRVITLDLRNHGASLHAAGMAYPDLAGDVLQTLASLDAVPCALLGHSMGGKTAMACALTAPSAVSRLLVADIAPVAYAHHNAVLAAALRAVDLQPGLTRMAADEALRGAVPDAGIRSFLLQNLKFGATPAWRIGLAHIASGMADIEAWPPSLTEARYDGPALFAAGADSDYINPSGRAAARILFPRAHFITLKHAGHWLHVDQPIAFIGVASRFFGA